MIIAFLISLIVLFSINSFFNILQLAASISQGTNKTGIVIALVGSLVFLTWTIYFLITL